MRGQKIFGLFRDRKTLRVPTCSLPLTLFIGLILSASAVFGQLVGIKKDGPNYSVEATAPPGSPHTLQASADFHLWVNLQDEVEDPFSKALNFAGASRLYFRLIPTPLPAPPIRVMVIGDSMSSDCCGWGRGFETFFKPNATVINYSQPWTSSKVFLQSAEMEKMLLVTPDYVLIQFGYSDGGADDGSRSTTPEEFKDNLRSIIQTVRGFNGIPILVTLHAARLWDEQGRLIPSDHPYNALTKQVATELNTPLIDLYQPTSALLSELGPAGAAFMAYDLRNPGDVMHVSPLGAIWVSRLVAQALPSSLGPYLSGIFDPPPNP